ncbi:MAG: hypothetical protein Kow0077_04030 [Anaerolineae bacterium]
MRKLLGLMGLALMIVNACTGNSSLPATPAATAPPTATPTLAPAPSPTPTVGAVPRPAAPEEPATGQLRIIQAAPESGALDIYLENGLIAGRLGFGSFTNPVVVETGVYYLQVVPVGALPDSQVLADSTLNIEADQSYLVLVSGTAETLIVTVYQEDLSPMSAQEARIAFLHAAPRTPATTPQIDSQPLADTLDYGQVSAGYTVPTGAHRVLFKSGASELASANIALAAQQAYTAVLIGRRGGEEARILLLNTPVETPGQFRMIHAAPQSPTIAIDLDGEQFADPIAYRQATGWQTLKPGVYTLRITNPEETDSLRATITETRITVGPNQAIEAVLLEDRGRPALRVYAHRLEPTMPGKAHLVVVNAAPYAPPVYAQTRTDRLTEIPQIPGAANSQPVEITAGRIELLWVSGTGENTRVIEWAGEITFRPGMAYTYVITGTDRDPFLLSTEVGLAADEAAASQECEPQLLAANALQEPMPLRVRIGEQTIDALPHRAALPVALPTADAQLRVGPSGDSPHTPDYLIATLAPPADPALIVLYGLPETMTYAILPGLTTSTEPSESALRIINAMAEEQAVTFHVWDLRLPPAQRAAPAFESEPIRPGEATPYVVLSPAAYDIEARRTAGDEILALIPSLALEARAAYDLIVLPTPNQQIALILLRTPPAA